MEIMGKLRDALSMFWQALDDSERRVLVFAACYVVAGAMAEASKRQRARMVAEIKRDVLEQVHRGR